MADEYKGEEKRKDAAQRTAWEHKERMRAQAYVRAMRLVRAMEDSEEEEKKKRKKPPAKPDGEEKKNWIELED